MAAWWWVWYTVEVGVAFSWERKDKKGILGILEVHQEKSGGALSNYPTFVMLKVDRPLCPTNRCWTTTYFRWRVTSCPTHLLMAPTKWLKLFFSKNVIRTKHIFFIQSRTKSTMETRSHCSIGGANKIQNGNTFPLLILFMEACFRFIFCTHTLHYNENILSL